MSFFSTYLPFLSGDNNISNSKEDMTALTDAYKAAHLKRPAAVGAHNYAQATADMQLTPQERALYERHLTNLNGPGGVDNPDGSRSSIYSVGTEHNGRYYVVPSVYDGKILPPREAMDRAHAAGINNFPSYPSEADGEARYAKMHEYMDKDTGEYKANQSAYANARINRGFDMFGPQPSAPAAPMLPAPPTPAPVDMGPPALSAQAMAPQGPPAPAPAPAVPMPQARPPEAPQAPEPMSMFQRNALMMRDPSSGTFIDPAGADRAQQELRSQASGPDVINKLLSYFHKKDDA